MRHPGYRGRRRRDTIARVCASPMLRNHGVAVEDVSAVLSRRTWCSTRRPGSSASCSNPRRCRAASSRASRSASTPSPAPPTSEAPAITAGRPVTNNSVPTAQRARKLVYAPDLDGRADPGEIVWTWVVYEDDPTRGKDRPVLVVGRDRRTLLGLDAVQPGTPPQRPRLGRHRLRQLGLRGPGQLGAAGPGARRARGGHPPRRRDPGARDVRDRRGHGCAPSTRGADLPRRPPHRQHRRAARESRSRRSARSRTGCSTGSVDSSLASR